MAIVDTTITVTPVFFPLEWPAEVPGVESKLTYWPRGIMRIDAEGTIAAKSAANQSHVVIRATLPQPFAYAWGEYELLVQGQAAGDDSDFGNNGLLQVTFATFGNEEAPLNYVLPAVDTLAFATGQAVREAWHFHPLNDPVGLWAALPGQNIQLTSRIADESATTTDAQDVDLAGFLWVFDINQYHWTSVWAPQPVRS